MNAIQFFDWGYISNAFDYSIKIEGVEQNINIVDLELFVHFNNGSFNDINDTHNAPNAPKTFIQQKIQLSQLQTVYRLNKQSFRNDLTFTTTNLIKQNYKSLTCILFFNTEREMRDFYATYTHAKMLQIANNSWLFKHNGYFTVMVENVPFIESLLIRDKQYKNKNLFRLNFTKK
jgi:hypothetical protein